ncbi:MAG: tRNA (adenosine(37)-N6)-threonylcarbamoyltransferase complex transferase subunit TsaD [Candidatus Atribacteria bacterium]|nr:tRNA (adenosine(37)-N6)-threonylcarbamoyltransferase complex transferase subunit TsaD [Candidatus Atribacteria bacterium]
MKEKLILGIETSCDETSVAIVKNGKEILSNIVASQINIHREYGGVVPEIASRKHMESFLFILKEALDKAGISLEDTNGIAVVNGPGLKGSLLVGLSFAKAIAFALNKPIIGVNHIEGHIYANFLEHSNLKTPFISLIVSGGHTSLILVTDIGRYQVLGNTRDDAAGEVLDKISNFLGLGYPGGPIIEKLAVKGNQNAINFPRPLMKSPNFEFSFSGLKTAVIYFIKEQKNKNVSLNLDDLCASFQQAVVDILVYKTISAAVKYNVRQIALGGGVAANQKLRDELKEKAFKKDLEVFSPPKELCTDNAGMIGAAGYYKLMRGMVDSYDLEVYTE